MIFYLCEAVCIFSCAFCFGSGVAQGEYNRTFIQAAHCSDDIMSEEPASPGHTCLHWERGQNIYTHMLIQNLWVMHDAFSFMHKKTTTHINKCKPIHYPTVWWEYCCLFQMSRGKQITTGDLHTKVLKVQQQKELV